MSPKLTPVRPTQEDAANLMRAVREAVRSGARAGMTSYNEIAEMLNAKGIAAPQARRWTAQSVATVLERAREAGVARVSSWKKFGPCSGSPSRAFNSGSMLSALGRSSHPCDGLQCMNCSRILRQLQINRIFALMHMRSNRRPVVPLKSTVNRVPAAGKAQARSRISNGRDLLPSSAISRDFNPGTPLAKKR
jgi:hypothetical protein